MGRERLRPPNLGFSHFPPLHPQVLRHTIIGTPYRFLPRGFANTMMTSNAPPLTGGEFSAPKAVTIMRTCAGRPRVNQFSDWNPSCSVLVPWVETTPGYYAPILPCTHGR